MNPMVPGVLEQLRGQARGQGDCLAPCPWRGGELACFSMEVLVIVGVARASEFAKPPQERGELAPGRKSPDKLSACLGQRLPRVQESGVSTSCPLTPGFCLHAMMSFTTFPFTSVSRMSRPA